MSVEADQAHRFLLPPSNAHSPACCFALFGSSRPDSLAVAGVGSEGQLHAAAAAIPLRVCHFDRTPTVSQCGVAWKSRVVCPYPTKRNVRWRAAAMTENVPCGADIPNR